MLHLVGILFTLNYDAPNHELKIYQYRPAFKVNNGECGHSAIYPYSSSCLSLRERENLADSIVDGKIILRWIFGKWNGAWTGLSWLRIGTGG